MSKSFNAEKKRKQQNLLRRALFQSEQTTEINQIITNKMETYITETGFPKIKTTDHKWLKLSGYTKTAILFALRLIIRHLTNRMETEQNSMKWTIRLTENWLLLVSICGRQDETTPFFSLSLYQREL